MWDTSIYKSFLLEAYILIKLTIHTVTRWRMGTVKTTITVDEDLWKKFSILVIQEKGYRQKRFVIENLIKQYVQKTGEKVDE